MRTQGASVWEGWSIERVSVDRLRVVEAKGGCLIGSVEMEPSGTSCIFNFAHLFLVLLHTTKSLPSFFLYVHYILQNLSKVPVPVHITP